MAFEIVSREPNAGEGAHEESSTVNFTTYRCGYPWRLRHHNALRIRFFVV